MARASSWRCVRWWRPSRRGRRRAQGSDRPPQMISGPAIVTLRRRVHNLQAYRQHSGEAPAPRPRNRAGTAHRSATARAWRWACLPPCRRWCRPARRQQSPAERRSVASRSCWIACRTRQSRGGWRRRRRRPCPRAHLCRSHRPAGWTDPGRLGARGLARLRARKLRSRGWDSARAGCCLSMCRPQTSLRPLATVFEAC